MILIKGNKALAKELGVNNNTISKWIAKGWIKPLKRIGNTIFWDLEQVLSEKKKSKGLPRGIKPLITP